MNLIAPPNGAPAFGASDTAPDDATEPPCGVDPPNHTGAGVSSSLRRSGGVLPCVPLYASVRRCTVAACTRDLRSGVVPELPVMMAPPGATPKLHQGFFLGTC